MRKIAPKAFTLMEIIIAITILGILGTIGWNYYRSLMQQHLDREAIANIKLMVAAEKLKLMDTGDNIECYCLSQGNPSADDDCDNTNTGCNSLLNLKLNIKNWTYRARFFYPKGNKVLLVEGYSNYKKSCGYHYFWGSDLPDDEPMLFYKGPCE